MPHWLLLLPCFCSKIECSVELNKQRSVHFVYFHHFENTRNSIQCHIKKHGKHSIQEFLWEAERSLFRRKSGRKQLSMREYKSQEGAKADKDLDKDAVWVIWLPNGISNAFWPFAKHHFQQFLKISSWNPVFVFTDELKSSSSHWNHTFPDLSYSSWNFNQAYKFVLARISRTKLKHR